MTAIAAKRHLLVSISRYAVLLVGAVIWSIPGVILVVGAIARNNSDVPALIPKHVRLANVSDVWTQTNLSRMLVNSTVITALSVVAVVVIGALAGFGFAYFRFRGAGIALMTLLSGVMLSPSTFIVPLYSLIVKLHLLNNDLSLIGPYVALGLPASALLFRNAFMTLPRELSESAGLDGAGPLTILVRIYLPLVRPTVVTVVIIQALSSWNDYLLALLFMTDHSAQTVQLAFLSFQGNYFSAIPKQFAVMVTVASPVVVIFILCQRAFVRGLTAGALK